MRLHLLTVAWHLLSAFKGGDERKKKKQTPLLSSQTLTLFGKIPKKENVLWTFHDYSPPPCIYELHARNVCHSLKPLFRIFVFTVCIAFPMNLTQQCFTDDSKLKCFHTVNRYLDLLGWKHACLFCLVSLWHENHFVPHLFGIFLSLFLISSAS